VRRFLINILLIICAVLLFNVGYIIFIGGNLRTYATKYLNFPDSVRVLVLGDSHAQLAWNSNSDGAIYNFANGSDNITDMRAKFEYASTRHKLIKGGGVVVLSFEPHLISPYRELKQNNRINSILGRSDLQMKVAYFLPLLFDPDTEFDFKRYFLALGSKNKVDSGRVFSEKLARARFQQHYPNDLVSKNLLKEYQDLVNSIRSDGYEIVALKYPVHPYFDSLIQNSPKSRHLDAVMDSLARSNGLRIVNYSTIINDPELFRDQDHLNREGSAIFINEFSKRFFARND
jgi:hypothetical protein